MRRDAGRPVLRSELRADMERGTYADDRPPLLKTVCHGDPGRCLWYKGRPMLLCARCTGFYLGLVIGLPWGVVMAFYGMTPLIVLLIFILTSAPLAADGISQYMGLRRSNNRLRLITGLSSGFGGGMGASYLLCNMIGIL